MNHTAVVELGTQEARMRRVFRKEPKVEVFKGRKGRFEGVHVSLQLKGRKVTRGLTPNPVVLLDFGVDAEGRPVSMGLCEVLDTPTIVRSIRMFLAGYEETPGGGPPTRRRPPIADPVTVNLLLRAVEKIAPRLAPWPVHPATRRRAHSA